MTFTEKGNMATFESIKDKIQAGLYTPAGARRAIAYTKKLSKAQRKTLGEMVDGVETIGDPTVCKVQFHGVPQSEADAIESARTAYEPQILSLQRQLAAEKAIPDDWEQVQWPIAASRVERAVMIYERMAEYKRRLAGELGGMTGKELVEYAGRIEGV
jgi:uncharacterized protein YbjQ (UPF0145 family)